jgi:WD40 repeat protein
MPSQSGSKAERRLLVAAGTAHFDKLADADLLKVPEELERIETAFRALGYELVQVVTDPTSNELKNLFATVRKACIEGDLVVAYYTGHGASDKDRFYLLTHESDISDLDATALPAEDLARALAKGSTAAQILMIIDTCYAGKGAADIAQVLSRLHAELGGAVPTTFVLAAARPKEEAEEDALCLALAQSFTMGGRLDPYLKLEDILAAIEDYLHPPGTEKKRKQQAELDVVAWHVPCRLFPNPRYRSDIRPGLDLESQRAFEEHWVPKASGAELGAGGWYFTGREQALRELAAWLRMPSSGARAWVVTGGAGCGKSAVLARVVTLSNPTYRTEVLVAAAGKTALDPALLPPENVVSVAVHARRKLLADVMAQITGALDVTAREPIELIDALSQRPDKTVIVVDALDEADEKERIVDHLLRPLAEMPRIFLLVGTRPDSSEPGRRFRALGDATVEIDLDDPRYVGADDVARYVERRLLATEEFGRATPYRASPDIARKVAQKVSERANNVFLVAHTVVQKLLAESTIIDIRDPGWIDRLPTGLDGAFAQFLGELDRHKPGGLSSAMARAVLLPLAFAEGEGLPWPGIWAAVATAISYLTVSYLTVQDADIALVREHAAAFIVEGLDNDRSVYRLYHEGLAESLRGSVDPKDAQQRIVETLRARVPSSAVTQERDWARAHPYVLTHLASHALKADVLGDLAVDGMFIAAAEPLRTRQALSNSTDALARRAFAGYSLALRNLGDRRSEDRLSYLEMAARQLGDDPLADVWIRQKRSRRWSVPWARWALITPHRVIPCRDSANSIALCALEGRPVIVSGGSDGVVRVWDLATGAPRGEPMRGHEGWVRSVAIGTLEGRPLVVSGGFDRTVRVWDLSTRQPHGVPLRGHDGRVGAVALGSLASRPVIVSGANDGTVRVWDLATGARYGEPLRGHRGRVKSVAVGSVDDRQVIVSGGEDGTLRVWDLTKLTPYGEPLKAHEGPVRSVSLGTLDRRPVIVSGGEDRKVLVWDLATRVQRGDPLHGHRGWVQSVAVGTLEGRPVIVSGGSDGTVRLWDLTTGAPRGGALHGHEGWVRSVVLGLLEGRPVIVSGGFDRTIRVWDLAAGAPCGEPSERHEGGVRTVAVGTLDARPVIVSGGVDRSVRVWDLTTGSTDREPLRGHEGGVSAVVVGQLEDRLVIVSGSDDGGIWVRDAASGAPLRGPLRGHEGRVSALTLGTRDGQAAIISGGIDGTVRVWDVRDGESATIYVGTRINGVACAESGTVVVVGDSGLMALRLGSRA